MLDRTMLNAALGLLALLTAAGAADAQQRYTPSDRFNPPSRFGDDRQGPARNTAGEFDYYALVLSWSPTYCASPDRPGPDPQCDRRDGRRFAFVLHGLWPQHDRGYPEYCPVRGRPFVPQPVIDGMLDIMPSPRLAIHEYKKHGTCSGLDPAGYYAVARKLFGAIKVPERYVNPFENQMVAPGELVSDFMRANPWLRPEMIAVSCGGAGSRLREIRICFNKAGTEPRSCGRNEDQRRMCSASRMFLPPVRSTRFGPDGGGGAAQEKRGGAGGSPLPEPRLPPSQRAL